MDILNTILNLFVRFGYPVIFLGVMAENAAIPVPGETILLAAGFFAAQGHFSLTAVIALAILGAILGDNIGYLVGRRAGRPFLDRYGRWLFLTPAKLDALQGFFRSYGDKTILVARFITGLRVVAALLAGISHMRWWIFFVYNAAGAILWATAMGLLGYFFGHSWTLLEAWIGRGGLVALGAILIGVLLIWLLRYAARLKEALGAILPRALRVREAGIILLNLTALAVFSKVAEEVLHGKATGLDRTILLAVHRLASPPLDAVMLPITFVGSGFVLIPVAGVLAIWCYRRGWLRDAKTMVLGLATTPILTTIVKVSFERARPALWDLVINLHDYSFPSGHATNALATFGLAAYILVRRYPRWWSPLYAAAAFLVAVVGFSRIYLGVHWPTDVLAGYSLGALVLFTLVYWYEWYEGNFGLPWQVTGEDSGRPQPLRGPTITNTVHESSLRRGSSTNPPSESDHAPGAPVIRRERSW